MDVLCPHKKEKKIITDSNREGKKEEPIYSILEPIPEAKVLNVIQGHDLSVWSYEWKKNCYNKCM